MFNVGIIGAGWIAHKMAQSLAPIKDIQVYAIASREGNKARDFAKQYHICYAPLASLYKCVARYFNPRPFFLFFRPFLGYEYEVMECKRCIEAGLTESPMMPHKETIAIMQQMDELRKTWGVTYPYD